MPSGPTAIEMRNSHDRIRMLHRVSNNYVRAENAGHIKCWRLDYLMGTPLHCRGSRPHRRRTGFHSATDDAHFHDDLRRLMISMICIKLHRQKAKQVIKSKQRFAKPPDPKVNADVLSRRFSAVEYAHRQRYRYKTMFQGIANAQQVP